MTLRDGSRSIVLVCVTSHTIVLVEPDLAKETGDVIPARDR